MNNRSGVLDIAPRVISRSMGKRAAGARTVPIGNGGKRSRPPPRWTKERGHGGANCRLLLGRDGAANPFPKVRLLNEGENLESPTRPLRWPDRRRTAGVVVGRTLS